MYKFLYIWYNITFWIKVDRKHTPDILPPEARLDLYIQYMLYTYIPFQKIHRKDMESLSLPACNHEPVPVVCSSRYLLLSMCFFTGFYSSWNPKNMIRSWILMSMLIFCRVIVLSLESTVRYCRQFSFHTTENFIVHAANSNSQTILLCAYLTLDDYININVYIIS